MPVFYALSSSEKREILVCVLHILRYLDDGSLVKSWQQNIARTRLFFKLLEECQELFEVRPYSFFSVQHKYQSVSMIFQVVGLETQRILAKKYLFRVRLLQVSWQFDHLSRYYSTVDSIVKLGRLSDCIIMFVHTNVILNSLVQYKKAGADGLMGAMPVNEQGKGTLCYSEKLSPAVNHFLSEASRQDVRVRLMCVMCDISSR